MGKTDVGPTAVADCGPMKMPMEARHRADEFCQLGYFAVALQWCTTHEVGLSKL